MANNNPNHPPYRPINPPYPPNTAIPNSPQPLPWPPIHSYYPLQQQRPPSAYFQPGPPSNEQKFGNWGTPHLWPRAAGNDEWAAKARQWADLPSNPQQPWGMNPPSQPPIQASIAYSQPYPASVSGDSSSWNNQPGNVQERPQEHSWNLRPQFQQPPARPPWAGYDPNQKTFQEVSWRVRPPAPSPLQSQPWPGQEQQMNSSQVPIRPPTDISWNVPPHPGNFQAQSPRGPGLPPGAWKNSIQPAHSTEPWTAGTSQFPQQQQQQFPGNFQPPHLPSHLSFPGNFQQPPHLQFGPLAQGAMPGGTVGLDAYSQFMSAYGFPPGPEFGFGPGGAMAAEPQPEPHSKLKKALPPWLVEEIKKKKAEVEAGGAAMDSGREEEEGGGLVVQMDLEGTEEDEIDAKEEEEKRQAAINLQIKRLLTEVLIEVTDEFIKEISTKVYEEDAKKLTEAKVQHKSTTDSIITLPRASSGKVVLPQGESADSADVSVIKASVKLLGLAEYDSDDEVDADVDNDHPAASEVQPQEVSDSQQQEESAAMDDPESSSNPRAMAAVAESEAPDAPKQKAAMDSERTQLEGEDGDREDKEEDRRKDQNVDHNRGDKNGSRRRSPEEKPPVEQSRLVASIRHKSDSESRRREERRRNEDRDGSPRERLPFFRRSPRSPRRTFSHRKVSSPSRDSRRSRRDRSISPARRRRS